MWCDIHHFIEIKPKWSNKRKIYDWESKYWEWYNEKFFDDPLYIWRNYNLFAILADVRNWSWFAWCDTWDWFIPLDNPRWLPDDVTDYVSKESDGWGVDWHSHSRFSLQELDVSEKMKRNHTITRWFISYDHYMSRKESGNQMPDWRCGYVWWWWIEKITQEQAESDNPIVKDLINRHRTWKVKLYVRFHQKQSYYDTCKYFRDEFVPALNQISEKDDCDVRVVFWFDN